MGVDARMLIKVPANRHFDTDSLRELCWNLASTCGSANFMEDLSGKWGKPHHIISIIEEYKQDGNPILPRTGEQFLKVHLYTRYYGPGYERGDWPVLRAVMAWWHLHFPKCEVWYGGDSSGICAEHITTTALHELDQHFLRNGRRPYSRYEGPIYIGHETSAPICPNCQHSMIAYCWSGKKTGFYCDGCSQKAIVENNEPPKFHYKKDAF